MLVRFVAVALMGWAVADLALYFVIGSHNQTPVEIGPCLIKALPLIIGVVILIRSKPLAEWVSNLLDN